MITHITAHSNASQPTVETLLGWTVLRQTQGVHQGEYLTTGLFWRIATQDDVDGTDYTWTIDNTQNCALLGAISVWTGHDPTSPINASNGQFNEPSTTITSPAITPSVADCMICLFCGVSGDNTQSNYAIADDDPGGWLEAYDTSTSTGEDVAIAMGYVIRPETTSTGNGTATSSASDRSTGQLVAISPPVAPPEEERHQTPHCGPKKLRTEWLSTMRM